MVWRRHSQATRLLFNDMVERCDITVGMLASGYRECTIMRYETNRIPEIRLSLWVGLSGKVQFRPTPNPTVRVVTSDSDA